MRTHWGTSSSRTPGCFLVSHSLNRLSQRLYLYAVLGHLAFFDVSLKKSRPLAWCEVLVVDIFEIWILWGIVRSIEVLWDARWTIFEVFDVSIYQSPQIFGWYFGCGSQNFHRCYFIVHLNDEMLHLWKSKLHVGTLNARNRRRTSTFVWDDRISWHLWKSLFHIHIA